MRLCRGIATFLWVSRCASPLLGPQGAQRAVLAGVDGLAQLRDSAESQFSKSIEVRPRGDGGGLGVDGDNPAGGDGPGVPGGPGEIGPVVGIVPMRGRVEVENLLIQARSRSP